MKIRQPFLAIERTIAARIIKTLLQCERRKRWPTTTQVINNIRLERILLHSLAISTVSPGIVSRTPSCVTGTRATAKSKRAAYADPCCKKLTIWSKANAGRGTNHSKKHRGKMQVRAILVPKLQTNDPIHHVTTASMATGNRISDPSWPTSPDPPPIVPITTAIISSAIPAREFGSGCAFRDLHSAKLKTIVMGRTRSMWVYPSFRSANPSALARVCHDTIREATNRKLNMRHENDTI